MSGPEQDHWLVQDVTIRRLWIAFIAILAGLVAADLFVSHRPHFGVDGWFGFGAWFGFFSCVVLVLFAKALGLFLKRPDTYYDS
jgi:sterol desaturase/sphingolipid hydroxylase (fatty acid hydroxylase superfamily)